MSNPIPVIISCATRGTGYEMEIDNLRRSLHRIGYPDFVTDTIDNLGSWEANVRARPAFIKDKIRRYGPVIWMDADSEALKFPDQFLNIPEGTDFGCCYFQWQKRRELSGAVLYFSGSQASIDVLTLWENECKRWPAGLSQPLLQTVIEETMVGLVKCHTFPVEYDMIFDLHAGVIEDPVIIQWQASRRFKRVLNQQFASNAERDIAYLADMFKGHRAIILGKGDSFNDLGKVDHKKTVVIGINDIYKSFPDLDMLFFFDTITFHENMEQYDAMEKVGVQLWTASTNKTRPTHRLVPLEREPYGFQPGKFFHSFTSAFICLQLAIHAGCKEIFLCGIDLSLPPTGDYFDGTRAREGEKYLRHLAKMRPGFEVLAKNIPNKVRIFRTSDKSTLDCFPVKRP